MTREELRETVLQIIAEIAPDEDLGDIDDEQPLRDQIDLDSMDFLDIVLALRKQHKVQVPESDYGELVTMKSTIDYLLPRMNGNR